jgi:PTS system nitrogen regulatory IIA component
MSADDFDIESLAAYLHLAPQQVARLADRGKLPGRKVAGQWRFSRAEIHHWLEERIGLAEDDDLVDVQGVLDADTGPEAAGEILLREILPSEAIEIPLRARTRNAVFTAMIKVAMRTGWLWDPERMVAAVRARENLYSTALDNGVALLHPRRPLADALAQPFLALGCTPNGIPFGGGRGGLTDVFFLICSVDDRGHLRTLARLSRVLGASGFLAALREAPDAAAAHRLIAATEAELGD